MIGGQVTQWLVRWRAGHHKALERLVPLVYDELRQVARRQIRRESPGHTLSPPPWSTRCTFVSCSSVSVDARILVGHTRARSRLKRGGEKRRVRLEPDDDVPLLSDAAAEEVLHMPWASPSDPCSGHGSRRVPRCAGRLATTWRSVSQQEAARAAPRGRYPPACPTRSPEPISIARGRELLGEEAESMTDQEVALIRRQAETMPCIAAQRR
jgi:hypothetical protein